MMLNWSLAYNMKHELLYLRMARKLGMDRAAKLLNLVPGNTPSIREGVADNARDGSLFAQLRGMGFLAGSRSASNNWVIAPDRTSGGGAILANDPHVHDSHFPSDFYLVHLKCPRYDVTGAQVAGVPGIVAGYNKNIAWGLTNNGADMADLFVEKVDLGKKTYRFQGKEVRLGEKKTVITVKGKGAREVTLLYAGRRPLLHQVFDDLGEVVSMDWTGYDGLDIQGFMMIHSARGYDEYLTAAKRIRLTPQNMVYADDKGTIAWRVVGSLPKRVKGTGNFPADGTKVKGNWEGSIPDDAYPSVKNPRAGYVITANNLTTRNFPHELNGTYAPRYRYLAIDRMVKMKKEHSLEDMLAMQNDVHSVLAGKVKGLIASLVNPGSDARVKRALEMVRAWDGAAPMDSAPAAISNTFLMRFMYRTFADELGEALAAEYVGQRYISLERFFELLEKKSDFFDDTSTPAKETPADIAAAAFRESLDLLEKAQGTARMERWTWGKVHVIKFDHPLGASKLLRPLVSHGPLAMDGDGETNRRAGFLEVAPPYITYIAAGMRMAVQFDPGPRGRLMLVTGENEYFMGPHDTDMIDAWMKGEYYDAEREPAKYRMVFSPGK